MALSKKACAILHEAERLLARPYGWVREDYRRKTRAGEGYCLVGAICAADGANELQPGKPRSSAGEAAIEAVGESLPTANYADSPRQRIFAFNDRQAKSKRDVLALLRKTREAEGC